MNIELTSFNESYEFAGSFKHSTNGKDSEFKTSFLLTYDEKFLKVSFVCADNTFTHENSMTDHNAPLYNQEVFEVFIGSGAHDSKNYLEVEINPNNAIWIGKIANPSLGESAQSLEEQVDYNTSGIEHGITQGEGIWSGYLYIPWQLIEVNAEGNYRINFYRIRSRVSHSDNNWTCDTETCDFVCWKSTLSGEEPAFHRPKQFGVLNVK